MSIAKIENFDSKLPSVRCSSLLVEDLELYAEGTGLSASHVVRKALEQYLYRAKQRKTPKNKNPGGS